MMEGRDRSSCVTTYSVYANRYGESVTSKLRDTVPCASKRVRAWLNVESSTIKVETVVVYSTIVLPTVRTWISDIVVTVLRYMHA